MKSYWMQMTETDTSLELRDVPVPVPGPKQLLVRMHAAGCDRGRDAGGEAEEDADAPEGRGDVLAPPLARRVGDEPSRERRVEERPDHERGHGQGDRCCGCTHAGHGNRVVLGIGTEILTG